MLIVNADDWGRDRETTDRTVDCLIRGSVTSVSGMVFMQDSERSAALAREHAVDVGLHLNLTSPFSAPGCSAKLVNQQHRIAEFLSRNAFARAVFHPGLVSSFDYVVKAQFDEFQCLYGELDRVDGHHHMHLCANVLFAGLLPHGIIARRNLTFHSHEKNLANRLYRRVIDNMLARSHHVTDYLFTLPPLEPADRLNTVFLLARNSVVELETHPIKPDEHAFLTSGEILDRARDGVIVSNFRSLQKRFKAGE